MMDVQDMIKLPFYQVYYTVEPLQANQDLQKLFNDSARFYNEIIVKDSFLYLVRTARKFGFRIFFKAYPEFFNPLMVESFDDGYSTPETRIEYKGLPNLIVSEKFN